MDMEGIGSSLLQHCEDIDDLCSHGDAPTHADARTQTACRRMHADDHHTHMHLSAHGMFSSSTYGCDDRGAYMACFQHYNGMQTHADARGADARTLIAPRLRKA